MDHVERVLASYEWYFAHEDPKTRKALAQRIAQAGRNQRLITYSELISGVTFCIPTVNGGKPFQIDPDNWSELDRSLIGEFLGYISWESYQEGRIFLSALVVTKGEGTPGPGFMNFLRELGVLTKPGQVAELECWTEQVRRVHKYYAHSGD